MSEEHTYDRDYFKSLGFNDDEIDVFVKGWNKKEPQTDKQVRQGIASEREGREKSADRWAKELEKHPPTE